MSEPRTHSRLPHFLATLYGLAIVYASLQPFANWLAPPPNAVFFLFAPWPPRWVRYDFVTNLVAYLPFGFFVALIPRKGGRRLLGRFLRNRKAAKKAA